MSKNKLTRFNLTEIMTKLSERVQKILEITGVENWDGTTVLEKEQQLREAGLILVGECTALLLQKLSELPQAQKIAIEKTKHWQLPKSVRNGRKWRLITTTGNVTVALHLPYVVERDSQAKGKKKSKNQGFCPFLRWLGMEVGVTPLVWSKIAEYAIISNSFTTARKLLKEWGIDISTRRIERLTYIFGSRGLSLRQLKLFELNQGKLPQRKVFSGKRVVISVDGGRTRLRVNKPGRKNSKTHRHGYRGEWVEPKLLTIYAVDEQGKKIKTADMTITNDGTYSDYQGLLSLLEMHLVDLGISQAKEVLLIADGAEWIWKHIPPLLSKLNCPVNTYQLIDFYHATEHLKLFADHAFSEDSKRHQWFKQARQQLKSGQISSLISQMNILAKSTGGETQKTMTTQLNYFQKHHESDRLNYAEVAAKKLPIGSGAVESLIRQVVNLRLKGNGKFWLKHHAEIILHSRCQLVGGNWEHFCHSILTAFLPIADSG
jgi:hypothetical protein